MKLNYLQIGVENIIFLHRTFGIRSQRVIVYGLLKLSIERRRSESKF